MPPLQRIAVVLAVVFAGACRSSVPVPPPSTPEERPVPVVRVPELPAPPAPLREFRAAWISPVWGGDWPSRPGLAPAAQQAELENLFDRAVNVGLNAVVLHVRAAADALYPSARVPWSVYLTGTAGRAPDYDPLAFAIEQAHRRGLELHVWFNPFRAAPPDHRNFRPPPGHVLTEHTSWVVRYGAQRWIDPGIPAARAKVLGDILEVVDRYDVDGVHLDDYFYPYIEQREVEERVKRGGRTRTVTRTENIPFPDDASWARYGQARFDSRADWRRANIDSFVAELYREVKARRPWVAVGISPFGIWRPGHPAGITGLNAYSEIFADARLWLREGWVDYLSPQLYWPIDGPQERFTRLDGWWREQNVHHRHIWPGLHSSRETDGSGRWPAGEIERQIETLRTARRGSGEANGHVHFRLQALRPAARGGIGETLQGRVYERPALTPAMPWLGRSAPAAPRARLVDGEAPRRLALRIAPGSTAPVRWWLVQVLGQDGWSQHLHPAELRELRLPADGVRAVAVSAIGLTGLQSTAVLHPVSGQGSNTGGE